MNVQFYRSLGKHLYYVYYPQERNDQQIPSDSSFTNPTERFRPHIPLRWLSFALETVL